MAFLRKEPSSGGAEATCAGGANPGAAMTETAGSETATPETGADSLGALRRRTLRDGVIVGMTDGAKRSLPVLAFQAVSEENPVKVVCLMLETPREHAFPIH